MQPENSEDEVLTGPSRTVYGSELPPTCKDLALEIDEHGCGDPMDPKNDSGPGCLLSDSVSDTLSEDYTSMTEIVDSDEPDMSTPTTSVCSDLGSMSEVEYTNTDTNDDLKSLEDQLRKAGMVTPPPELAEVKLSPDSPEGLALKLKIPTDEEWNNSEDNDSQENNTSSGFYEDREFEFLRTKPLRKSTSLKTYKTPPGTPSRKKVVRFADALGLDLESVRHILNLDTPPLIPPSATQDLKVGLEDERKTQGNRYLSACFSQPGVAPDFLMQVKEKKVMLENCLVDDQILTVTGTIRVANICFHKSVLLRCTVNNWLTHDDVHACYVLNSNDGITDRFSFTLSVPQYFGVGNRLEFCILYAIEGAEFWDNNYGANYIIECYARSFPTVDSDHAWMHFL